MKGWATDGGRGAGMFLVGTLSSDLLSRCPGDTDSVCRDHVPENRPQRDGVLLTRGQPIQLQLSVVVMREAAGGGDGIWTAYVRGVADLVLVEVPTTHSLPPNVDLVLG